MSAPELPSSSVLAILVMGAATLLMRASGFWLMGHMTLTPRVRRMLDALPGSIVAATVLPIVANTGPVAVVAVAATLATMILRRNELLAVACGVVVAALARSMGI